MSFYLKQAELPEFMAAVKMQVLGQYDATPHFLGTTVMKHDAGERAEVVMTSFWDDGLDGALAQEEQFVKEIHRITGASPSRKVFDTLYAQVRDSTGNFRSTD